MNHDNAFFPSAGDLRGRPPEYGRVFPELLVGEYPRVEDVAWLRRDLGVTAVVSLQDAADLAGKGLDLASLVEAYDREQIEFVRIPVADNDYDGLRRILPQALARIDELVRSGHRVFVHCNAGYNRAPTVVIGYLHVHRAMSLDQACRLLKSERPCVPFMTLLRDHFGRGPAGV